MNKSNFDIDRLVSDKETFDKFVYTPLEEAVIEIKRRREDKALSKYVEKSIAGEIPDPLKKGEHIVLHRQLVTPNYEVLRFMIIADALDLEPIFFEYPQDKFVTENEWKYALTHMRFFSGVGKKGGEKTQSVNVIDFNASNGKKIEKIKTLWGQSLVDFHHELFLQRFPNFKCKFIDGSQWYSKNGGIAKKYYKPFLSLFLKNSLLFDNFLTNHKEILFTKEILLPAFIDIMNETGLKPLIIALEPTEIESEEFWVRYPSTMKGFVDNKLKSGT